MMNTNRKAFIQRALNQQALTQQAVNQRAVIQNALNQRAINQRAINQRALRQHALNQQDPVIKTENQINLLCVKNIEKMVYVPVDIPENNTEIVLNKI